MSLNSIKLSAILLMLFVISISGQQLKQGDGIKISFYNIDEQIQGEYFIQENGRIHLPYIGNIDAQSLDFAEVQNMIITEYSKIYRNPEISVQPLLRVDIIGEVGNPGVYYLTGFETITDLLALAGGETNDSKIESIFIMRNDTQLEIDLEEFLYGKSELHDIGIESGDKIYVPRTWWVGARDASVIVSGLAVLVTIAGLLAK